MTRVGAPPRWVDLNGCFNFRDLGGYRARDGRITRWQRLYRSDALDHLTPHDVARVRDEVGLKAIIDLRSQGEVDGDGRGPLAVEPIHYHRWPLFSEATAVPRGRPEPSDLLEHYLQILQAAHGTIAAVINLLADAPHPVVFHCAAGKDRTGLVAAVLLGTLGVEDAEIVRDYTLTSRNLGGIIERLMDSATYQTMLRELPPDAVHARPETMTALLDAVRAEHGSMRAFARAAGVTERAQQRLEALLLTDELSDRSRSSGR